MYEYDGGLDELKMWQNTCHIYHNTQCNHESNVQGQNVQNRRALFSRFSGKKFPLFLRGIDCEEWTGLKA